LAAGAGQAFSRSGRPRNTSSGTTKKASNDAGVENVPDTPRGARSGVRSMTYRSYSSQPGLGEKLGLVLGGGALLAVISAQVLFVAWII
jgi:hypothetical protein